MDAYTGQGWVYVRLPMWQFFAVPDLIKAIEQDPPLAGSYANRGFVHFKKAQWAQVFNDLDKAYKKDPALNRNAWNRDWATGKSTQWDTVMSDYQKTIELASRQPSSPISPGSLKEEIAQAIGDYNKAIELSQDVVLIQKAKDCLKYIDEFSKAIAK
jgi:tetratricopeptide (TPR) repeat protein